MKELWAVELDLLHELDRVCKEYGLRYAAAYGTLLGAVRHSGFIPWDDDLDVVMPRRDYDTLLSIAPQAFTPPYDLEWFGTDPEFIYDKAKLLNLNTTAVENPLFKKHAVFLDIFPIDNISDNEEEQNRQGDAAIATFSKFQRIGTCSNRWYRDEKGISGIRRAARYAEWIKNKMLGREIGGKYHKALFDKLVATNSKFNDTETLAMGDISSEHKTIHYRMPTDAFDDLVYHDFEYMTIPIHKDSDAVLRNYYGDYMQPVMGGAAHSFYYLDLDHPFTGQVRPEDYYQ